MTKAESIHQNPQKSTIGSPANTHINQGLKLAGYSRYDVEKRLENNEGQEILNKINAALGNKGLSKVDRSNLEKAREYISSKLGQDPMSQIKKLTKMEQKAMNQVQKSLEEFQSTADIIEAESNLGNIKSEKDKKIMDLKDKIDRETKISRDINK